MVVIFLDTYAMIELFEGNRNYLPYKDMSFVTTRFNLLEFYYVVLSRYGREKADFVFENYESIAKEADNTVLKAAALFKLEFKKKRFSFADCVGYKYAESMGARFLTGDEAFRDFSSMVEFVK